MDTICIHTHDSIFRWGTTSRKVACSFSDEVTGFFNWPNHSSRTMFLGPIQPVTEMSTRNSPAGKRRPARNAHNITAICEPIDLKMWVPRRLTTSTACYMASFTFMDAIWRHLSPLFYLIVDTALVASYGTAATERDTDLILTDYTRSLSCYVSHECTDILSVWLFLINVINLVSSAVVTVKGLGMVPRKESVIDKSKYFTASYLRRLRKIRKIDTEK
jgi:hypothetical protein